MRVEREVFESSLRSARTVLEVLGFAPHEARIQAMRFRRHNLELFERMYPHHKDRAKVIAVIKQGRQQLEEQMAQERAEKEQRLREGASARRTGAPDPARFPLFSLAGRQFA
jgi:glutathione-regulated potassium-efflux system ancillary protein KefC